MSPSPAVPPASARATRRVCGWDVVRLSSLQVWCGHPQSSPSGSGIGKPGWCLLGDLYPGTCREVVVGMAELTVAWQGGEVEGFSPGRCLGDG